MTYRNLMDYREATQSVLFLASIGALATKAPWYKNEHCKRPAETQASRIDATRHRASVRAAFNMISIYYKSQILHENQQNQHYKNIIIGNTPDDN